MKRIVAAFVVLVVVHVGDVVRRVSLQVDRSADLQVLEDFGISRHCWNDQCQGQRRA